ncbi:MAG TPA: isochorismatase family protein [Candidatus Limnocylindria bacterium]
MATMDVPDLPNAAAVALDPATTAVLVLDLSDVSTGQVPAAKESVPAIRKLLDRAREHGARVIFSLGRAPQEVVPELGRRENESIVKSSADKFFQTDLDQQLQGITHAVIVGTAANGAVLYTAFGACSRGIAVVVPEDGMSSRQPIATWVAKYQLLNQPGFTNAQNTPLQAKAVTISRTDLISFVKAKS